MSDKPESSDTQTRPANNNIIFAVIILLILICAAAFALLKPTDEASTASQVATPIKEQPIVELTPEQTAPATESAPIKAEMRSKPIEKQVTQPVVAAPEPEVEPLPSLDDSDSFVISGINEYLNDSTMKLILTDDVIRRGVVFIDNIATGKIAKNHTPVVKPQGKFSIIDGDILIIDPNSYERYTPYVKIFTGMSAAQVVRLYKEFEPLINTAYIEIGYNDGEFYQTLNDAIDLLLDTPDPDSELPLLRDSVNYQYAYSEWEQLPAAQKQLLRMGPENMKKVKAALRNIKKQLANK